MSLLSGRQPSERNKTQCSFWKFTNTPDDPILIDFGKDDDSVKTEDDQNERGNNSSDKGQNKKTPFGSQTAKRKTTHYRS